MRATAWQIGALLAVLGPLPACGKRDRAPAEEEEPAPPQATDPAPSEEPPAEPDSEPFDLDAFCAHVFSPDDVGTIVGVEGVTAVGVPGTRGPGTATCNLSAGDAFSATLAADCGSGEKVFAAWQTSYQQASPESFAEVDVGRGGVRIAPADALYQLGFFDDDADCAVVIVTREIEEDHTVALARHAAARLRENARPR